MLSLYPYFIFLCTHDLLVHMYRVAYQDWFEWFPLLLYLYKMIPNRLQSKAVHFLSMGLGRGCKNLISPLFYNTVIKLSFILFVFFKEICTKIHVLKQDCKCTAKIIFHELLLLYTNIILVTPSFGCVVQTLIGN